MIRTLVDVLAAAAWRMGALMGRPPFPYSSPAASMPPRIGR